MAIDFKGFTIPRAAFLQNALQIYRDQVPYLWAGKNPVYSAKEESRWRTGGLDCSGLVTHLIKTLGGPDLRANCNTDRLWADLPAPKSLTISDRLLPAVSQYPTRPGDLVLYQGSKPNNENDMEHVMIYLGAGLVLGMAPGGSKNTSVVYSRDRGHICSVKPIDYRKGFAGFRELPLV